MGKNIQNNYSLYLALFYSSVDNRREGKQFKNLEASEIIECLGNNCQENLKLSFIPILN